MTVRTPIRDGADFDYLPLDCSCSDLDIVCPLHPCLNLLRPLLLGNWDESGTIAKWTFRSGYFNAVCYADFSISPGSLLYTFITPSGRRTCSRENVSALVIKKCPLVDEVEIRLRELRPLHSASKLVELCYVRNPGSYSIGRSPSHRKRIAQKFNYPAERVTILHVILNQLGLAELVASSFPTSAPSNALNA